MKSPTLAVLAFAVFAATGAARAQDTIIMGSVGSTSANSWPTFAAVEKGFFADAKIKPDFVYAQSNANVIQQLTAGSLNVSTNSGLVDPIRAIEKGAPLAIIRVEVQKPPYALMGRSAITSIKQLKGRTISVGGPKDITRLYVDRMLEGNGMKSSDVDLIFAGATSARFSALQSGAVDAAILTPPFNFHAATAGFSHLGNAVDYSEIPFAGIATNTRWAAANKDLVERLIGVYNRSIAWLYDPANRDEAIAILMKTSRLGREEVAKSYDYLIGGQYFEPTGTLSRRHLGALVDGLKALGDIPPSFAVDRVVIGGMTQTTN